MSEYLKPESMLCNTNTTTTTTTNNNNNKQMEVTSGADVQEKTRRKIKWTKEMNEAVLSCKHNARILVKSDEAPLSESGRNI